MTPEELADLKAKFEAMAVTGRPLLYSHLWKFVASKPELLDFYRNVEPQHRDPELLMAAVHYEVLDTPDEELSEIFQAPDARDAVTRLPQAFLSFCMDYEDEIRRAMEDRLLQTNEANRSAALLPALMLVARESHRPLALIDLGTSAGVNQLFDRFRYDYNNGPVLGAPGASVRVNCDLRGHIPRIEPNTPMVDFRIGIDIEPVGHGDEDHERWLRACNWVGDVGAEQRLDGALQLARREWPEVIDGDVTAKLERVVTQAPDHAELCLFSSLLLDQLTEEERADFLQAVRDVSHIRTIWWITFERKGLVEGVDDSAIDAPCVLAVRHLVPGEESVRVLAGAAENAEWLSWVDGQSTAW